MRKGLSDLEMELLKYLAEGGAKSSREATEEFGEERGYSRSTITTLFERLREKGYVRREKVEGAFRYGSVDSPGDVNKSIVERFIGQAFGGSVMPLVTYLADSHAFTKEELAEVRRLVKELEDPE
jgi:predicted transcriptional regulator